MYRANRAGGGSAEARFAGPGTHDRRQRRRRTPEDALRSGATRGPGRHGAPPRPHAARPMSELPRGAADRGSAETLASAPEAREAAQERRKRSAIGVRTYAWIPSFFIFLHSVVEETPS